MKTCLIVTYGFIGDILIQSGIARHLIENKTYDAVDMVIGFVQPRNLLSNNPWIRKVFMGSNSPSPHVLPPKYLYDYTKVFYMKPFTFDIQPPLQAKKWCDIETDDSGFQIFTEPYHDCLAWDYIRNALNIVGKGGKPIVAYLNWTHWEEKTFGFTPEEYQTGYNVPYKGYGNRNRNIRHILWRLKESNTCRLLEVGGAKGQSQFNPEQFEMSYDLMASVIKHCDYFIGPEGGVANLSYGVGTPTILTSDFVHMLYGFRGCIKQIPEPKLGPRYYTSDKIHVDLDPYLTDDQVADKYIEHFQNWEN